MGYENRTLQNRDFSDDRIDAGEIGSGHTVTALYEVVLAGSKFTPQDELRYRYRPAASPTASASQPPAETLGELAFLKIRYKEPEGSSSKLLEYPIFSAAVQDAAESSSDDFRFAAAVEYFAHKLRRSRFSGSYSYQDISRLAQAARGEDPFGYRQEFIELVKDAAAIDK